MIDPKTGFNRRLSRALGMRLYAVRGGDTEQAVRDGCMLALFLGLHEVKFRPDLNARIVCYPDGSALRYSVVSAAADGLRSERWDGTNWSVVTAHDHCANCGHFEAEHEQEADNSYCFGQKVTGAPCACTGFKQQ